MSTVLAGRRIYIQLLAHKDWFLILIMSNRDCEVNSSIEELELEFFLDRERSAMGLRVIDEAKEIIQV